MDDMLRNKMQKWHGSNWNTDVRTILPDILEYITERDDGRGLPPFGYYIGSPFMDQVSPEDFERGLEMLCEEGKMRKFENWNGGILYTTSGCDEEKNEEKNWRKWKACLVHVAWIMMTKTLKSQIQISTDGHLQKENVSREKSGL